MLCTFALVPDDSTRIWENEWLPWGQGVPLHAISVRCPSLIDRLLLQHVPNRVKWSNYIWLNCSNSPTFILKPGIRSMRRWYPTISDLLLTSCCICHNSARLDICLLAPPPSRSHNLVRRCHQFYKNQSWRQSRNDAYHFNFQTITRVDHVSLLWASS